MGPDPAPLMSAPELTLRTSGITWRTEGYGGPDNDVRLSALGELCVDVQRLARSTLVRISASDSPASSSASAAPNRFREAHVARRSSRRGTTGRRTVWANVWPIVVGPRILAGPARSRARRPRSTPARMVVVVRSCRSTAATTFFGVAVGQGVRYQPIRIAVP
jgi:hypothetical protein